MLPATRRADRRCPRSFARLRVPIVRRSSLSVTRHLRPARFDAGRLHRSRDAGQRVGVMKRSCTLMRAPS